MKNKIIMITALLALMAAMTGIAAAANNVVGIVYIEGTSTVVQDANVKAFDVETNSQLGSEYITGSNGRFIINVGDYSLTTIKVTATKNGVTATATGNLFTEVPIYLANVFIPIPEFATVAIPIAAVLGLVFFFQQKKNKKE